MDSMFGMKSGGPASMPSSRECDFEESAGSNNNINNDNLMGNRPASASIMNSRQAIKKNKK